MNEKKYKLKKSYRLQGYDYSSEGAYFITINTKNRKPYFGRIHNKVLGLSSIGSVVAVEWQNTSLIRPNIILGNWVVMPDHFHAIVYITTSSEDKENSMSILHQNYWSPFQLNSLPQTQGYKNKFGPQRKSLGAIIRGFKSSCTRQIKEQGVKNFGWQERFQDRIIRSQEELTRVEHYIENNIYNVDEDSNLNF